MNVTVAADRPSVLPELTGFSRPRYRQVVPILWRCETSIQLGDDVVVDRVSRTHVAWLTSLDGLSSPAAIEDSLTIPEQDARRLLRAMLAAGALEDAGRLPDALRWAPSEERDRLSGQFAATVDTHRDLARAFDLTARRDRTRIAIAGDGDLARAVGRAVHDAGLARDDRHPHIVVLADPPHPDVTAHFDQPQLDLPHVHVGVLGARAVVGPAVLPGVTSCLRCAHLHRRDADPAWPLVAVQWAHAMRGPVIRSLDRLLVRLASAHAALLVRAMVDDPEAHQSWAGHALELRLPDPVPTRAPRPPHPLCGCTWAAA